MINFQLERASFISRKSQGLQDHLSHHGLAEVVLGNSISKLCRVSTNI